MNDKPLTNETLPLDGKIVEDIDTIAEYDPEMRFRRLSGLALKLMYAMTLILSIFHIYTAGFGVLQEWRHRTFHLAFVLPLVFFLYTMRKSKAEGKKYLVYDILYGITGSALVTTMCRELFSLSPIASSILALATFGPDRRLDRFPGLHGHDCGDRIHFLSGVFRPPFPDLVRGSQRRPRLLGLFSARDFFKHHGPVRSAMDHGHPDDFQRPGHPV
jgi:hypothetical protein